MNWTKPLPWHSIIAGIVPRALACGLLLLATAVSPANAQLVLAVDLNKGKFVWEWTQGTGGPATGFLVRCGGAAGGPYLQESIINDPAARTLPVKSVIGVGSWFCISHAFNSDAESLASNEISFRVFLAPVAPTNLHIEAQ